MKRQQRKEIKDCTHTHTHTLGGAGAFKYPIVPLWAASSDVHQMGLGKELIWAASRRGKLAVRGGVDWGNSTTHLVPNQVNVPNSISGTNGHTQLSSSSTSQSVPPIP